MSTKISTTAAQLPATSGMPDAVKAWLASLATEDAAAFRKQIDSQLKEKRQADKAAKKAKGGATGQLVQNKVTGLLKGQGRAQAALKAIETELKRWTEWQKRIEAGDAENVQTEIEMFKGGLKAAKAKEKAARKDELAKAKEARKAAAAAKKEAQAKRKAEREALKAKKAADKAAKEAAEKAEAEKAEKAAPKAVAEPKAGKAGKSK